MKQEDLTTHLAFSIYENPGVFAVLVGSGLSRAAQIPTGWEITLDLIRRVAVAEGIEEQEDWAQWYRDGHQKEPNYSELLEDLGLTPDERRSILHSYIEPTDQDREEGNKQPTAAHLAIADLVRAGYVRVIITTNFDRLLENALRDRGIEPTVIGSPDALAGAEPLTHSKCYILKLHGDYKDARIRNTDSELGAYPAEYDALLDRIFDDFGLIVAGWSGDWDHALRTAILRAPNRRYPMYWAARGKVSNNAQELLDQRKGRAITIADADSFFRGIEQRVETLSSSHRRNPLSTDLLIGTAKRYLAKPEFRIQLDQLIDDEMTRLRGLLNESDFPLNGDWSKKEFRSRVERLESVAEPLAKVASLMGRWGDGSETSTAIDLVRSLYSHGEVNKSGKVVWLNLMTYPAMLIFYSHAISLVRSERFAELHALLSAQFTDEYREPKRLVEMLFLWGWKGSEKQTWGNIEGFERRHTPLSDRLHEVFCEWTRSTLGYASDFTTLFEKFEMLASMKFLDSSTDDEIELSHENQNIQFRAIGMPIGRIGWDYRTKERLAAELSSGSELSSKLIESGFVRGQRFIDLFLKNQNILSARQFY